MTKSYFRELAKKALKKLRIEVRRLPQVDERSRQPVSTLPTLFDEPLEALAYNQVGNDAAFKCPLEYTVKLNGLSYGPSKWHPFVETIKEFMAGKITSYEGSVLEAYYKIHQPVNAAEAVISFEHMPAGFQNLSAHLYRLSPWRSETAEQIDIGVRRFTKQDSLSHGKEKMTLESDGYLYHGPVSMKKGILEYKRLIQTYLSIKNNGYKRELGHAHFLVLRRGDSYRYLSQGNGNHRTAAMAALGYETIPAVFQRSIVLDIKMVDYWPQVCNGIWSREEAIAYFNHLFDFNSRAWAREKGFLIEKQ